MPGEKQTEAAAQIVLTINGTDLRVRNVDTTTDVNIEMIYGNNLKPDGWAVTEIAYDGSLEFHGDVAGTVNGLLSNDDVPEEGNSLTITHMDGSSETYTDVMMSQHEYSMSEGEVTETTYEWVAMDKR